jgi:hypothetical protein
LKLEYISLELGGYDFLLYVYRCFCTLQPALFENIVNETIQHLHEVVVQNKLGESEVIFPLKFVNKQQYMIKSNLSIINLGRPGVREITLTFH